MDFITIFISPFVMVNLMGQLDFAIGYLDIWLSVIALCVSVCGFRRVQHLFRRLSKTDYPSLVQMGIIQSIEGLNKTNRWKKEKFFLSALVLELEYWSSCALELVLTPQVLLVLRLLDLDWNCTTGIPGSSACRWQIIGLLSFRNHIS